jgi:hypothetical protein
MGRNAKKAGRHQPESDELMEANKAMSENYFGDLIWASLSLLIA